MSSSTSGKVAVNEVKRFIVDCLTRVGSPEDHASAMADVLTEADRRGHFSHGLNRLGKSADFMFCCLIHYKPIENTSTS